ncbi:ribosomal-protein-alanine N-acetyltransferase [Nanoarchaeota archaeon]|nr:MAG: ribosomal-protein-alanine N-acetyltransferase [Nanoarchaeota archaeon]
MKEIKETLRVERFVKDYLNEVLEVEKECFPKKPYDAKTFLHWYSSEPEGFLIVRLGEEIAGYIIASSVEKEIISIAVKKKFRNLGIGSFLLKEALNYLFSKGAEEVVLHVRVGNKRAIEFYERNGFEIVKKIEGYYGDEDAYLMKLPKEKFFNGKD